MSTPTTSFRFQPYRRTEDPLDPWVRVEEYYQAIDLLGYHGFNDFQLHDGVWTLRVPVGNEAEKTLTTKPRTFWHPSKFGLRVDVGVGGAQ